MNTIEELKSYANEVISELKVEEERKKEELKKKEQEEYLGAINLSKKLLDIFKLSIPEEIQIFEIRLFKWKDGCYRIGLKYTYMNNIKSNSASEFYTIFNGKFNPDIIMLFQDIENFCINI